MNCGISSFSSIRSITSRVSLCSEFVARFWQWKHRSPWKRKSPEWPKDRSKESNFPNTVFSYFVRRACAEGNHKTSWKTDRQLSALVQKWRKEKHSQPLNTKVCKEERCDACIRLLTGTDSQCHMLIQMHHGQLDNETKIIKGNTDTGNHIT